ncbi:hypothetical protein NL64_06290 [Pseudomonas fluorescens]|uniref:hypothetical protein n=1 Tax=Pseudomonas fluorescens TaxID=294 RepID=UPI00054B6006|nr:hypothetical protein [Pseudomonas fluorescens]KII34867.1 hypothetical protein NL64_06290 [Pseudomonas fluorescens]
MSLPPIYIAYDLMTRQFYHDDGGDSRDSERLLIASTDLDLLRSTINAHYAEPDRVRSHYGTTLFIPTGKMKSNRWSGSGGGCMASGHIEIRKLNQLAFAS